MTSMQVAPATTTLTVDPEENGRRLDAFLAARLDPLSRSRVQALIREGHVAAAAGVIAEPSLRVKPGEVFNVSVPEPREAVPAAEAMPLEILYEDEHLIVIVKPAGIVVHPAPGHRGGTLVNALLAHCGVSLSGVGGVKRPGIVHRLDKDVSGVLVVAKHDRAHIGLAAQFTVHSIHRIYEAIVWGVPSVASGRIDGPIGRDARDRLRMAVVAGGKRAATRYRLLEAAGIVGSRLELTLETGRTHQIRVHLAHLGHPIIGDRLYGRRKLPPLAPAAKREIDRLDRIALHARELAFEHPVTGARIHLRCDPPPLFSRLLELLR
jgi:23S rRNA pseudouridine1911/1915/1917 synthase